MAMVLIINVTSVQLHSRKHPPRLVWSSCAGRVLGATPSRALKVGQAVVTFEYLPPASDFIPRTVYTCSAVPGSTEVDYVV